MSLSRPGYCAPKGAWVCLLLGFYKYKLNISLLTERKQCALLTAYSLLLFLPHGSVCGLQWAG